MAANGEPTASECGSPPAPLVSAQETGGANSQPARTLEDAVADLLRPMLQQWLSDNMPRIIEKALRVEATQGVKSQLKPPGA
jgi:hypothetical protein